MTTGRKQTRPNLTSSPELWSKLRSIIECTVLSASEKEAFIARHYEGLSRLFSSGENGGSSSRRPSASGQSNGC